jgi:alpha-1,3-rhamnosyltransferase
MTLPPRASIGVLSFNNGRYLSAAIESALVQTYPNVEVIVADDGSTDGSVDLAQRYAERYPLSVKVCTHRGRANRGVAATSNLAFENATGRYWSVLGSDDVLYPHKIAVQVEWLERHPDAGFVYGYVHHIDANGRRLPDLGLFGEDITRAADPLACLLRGNRIPAITVLARRALVDQLGREDESLVYSDWHLWIRMLARHPVAFLPRVLARYRVHGRNTSVGASDAERFQRSIDVLESIRQGAQRFGGRLADPRTIALIDEQMAALARQRDGAVDRTSRTRASVYWARRHVLGALVRDHRAWRDRDLFGAYVDALAGPRIGKRLARLFPSASEVRA